MTVMPQEPLWDFSSLLTTVLQYMSIDSLVKGTHCNEILCNNIVEFYIFCDSVLLTT